MMGLRAYEPSSNARQMARTNYELYQAHIQAGFTPEQTMQIICSAMSAVIMNQPIDPDEK